MRIKVKLYFNDMIWLTIDWIPLTQDSVKWQAFLNTVTTEWLPSNEENILTRRE